MQTKVKTDILLKSLHDKITPLERKTWSLKCDHWRKTCISQLLVLLLLSFFFFFQLQPFWQNEQIWENKLYCKYYEHDILYTGFQSFRFTPFALVKGCTLKGGTLWFFWIPINQPENRSLNLFNLQLTKKCKLMSIRKVNGERKSRHTLTWFM